MSFDVNRLVVVLEHDLTSGCELGLREYLMSHEHILVLLIKQMRHGIRSCLEVGKSSYLYSFLYPLIAVTVTVEQDPLVLCNNILNEVMKFSLEVGSILEDVSILSTIRVLRSVLVS